MSLVGIHKGEVMESFQAELDTKVWEWCNRNNPNLALAKNWYSDNGPAEKLMELFKALGLEVDNGHAV